MPRRALLIVAALGVAAAGLAPAGEPVPRAAAATATATPATAASTAARPAPLKRVVARREERRLRVSFAGAPGTAEVALRGRGTRSLKLTKRRGSALRGWLTTRIRGRRTLPAGLRVAVRRCRARRKCSRWRTVTPQVVNDSPPPGTPTPASPSPPGSVPTVGSCPVLPADHAFNQDVSSLPVDPRSEAYVASIGLDATLHPDFGSADLGGGPGGFGIPYVVVPGNQPLVPVDFTAYGEESDPGPYPVPLDAPIEGGAASDGDRHVLAVREGDCKLFELGNAYPEPGGWKASGGAVWDLRNGGSRPARWTSADAAGLPILPGLVRYDEVAAGEIRHALRFTVQRTQRAYIAPASHWASTITDPNVPPMGLRLRMRAGYDLSGLRGQALVVAKALQRYGLIVADNGSNWFISGAPDPRWDDDDLRQLRRIPGSAFEVVQTGAVVRP